MTNKAPVLDDLLVLSEGRKDVTVCPEARLLHAEIGHVLNLGPDRVEVEAATESQEVTPS